MEIDEASNEASASNADAAVATRRSSSRRKRGNAETESNEQEQLESNHPLANAKDASVYSLQILLMLQSRNANYFNKLDFVHVSDIIIIIIIVIATTIKSTSLDRVYCVLFTLPPDCA